MANNHLLVLVIIGLVGSSIQDVTNNKVDSQEESPLADVAQAILKEQNLENIGGMVSNFIQSGGAKNLIDGVLQNMASNGNSGQLLESFGSLLNTGSDSGGAKPSKKETKKSNDDINPMELLSGLGSIVGAMQGVGEDGQANPAALLQGLGSLVAAGTNGGGGAALLQGLGSLLGNAAQNGDKKQGDDSGAGALLQGLGSVLGAVAGGNQEGGNNAGALLQGLGSLMGGNQDGGQGGLNPELIGNMINMFANAQGGANKREAKPSKSKPPKKAASGKSKPKKDNNKPKKPGGKNAKKAGGKNAVDGILSLANTFLGGINTGQDGGGLDVNFIFENFPLFIKMAKSLGGPDIKKYLDPVDDFMYVYEKVKDPKTGFDIYPLLPRILKIYTAYQELVGQYFKSTKKLEGQDDSLDLGNIISMASSFLNQGNNNGKGGSNFMEYLPMIMNTINSFAGPEAQERAHDHSGHSWALPPVLEKLHIYWDNFLNSDMGRNVFSFIGEQKAFKVFQDGKGNFDYDKFKELIENHSFRRHWIQQVTTKLVELLRIVSNKNVQTQYIDMGVTFGNSFLANSGFPKKALINLNSPVKSISSFAKFAAKKYLDADVDTTEYVEPMVLFSQDILRMAKESIKLDNPRELTDTLTDAINMEIIEPITRVNRAYRFAKTQPNCDRYIFCLINQKESDDTGSLPRLKRALYKGYSLIAGWFLTSHTRTSYWDLYAVITENGNCQKFHNDSCNDFYQEEIKATTEYIHNEL